MTNSKYCAANVLFRFQLKYHEHHAGSHEHPKAVTVLYGLANSFYKSRCLQRRARTAQEVPYKLKFSIKIGRYSAMPFMVMSFKKEIFRDVFGTV